jgi:putative nucleotidyltransferase with HDIG domain
MTAPPPGHLKQIVDSVDEVASLPDVTARIIQAVDDPRSSPLQLLKLVSHDPALVARILKLVNSSFYSLPNKIASLDRAIALLGMASVRNLAIATSLAGMFRGGQLCEGFGPRDLWTHSIAVAVVARELSKKLRLPLTDEAFLIGMLHDLGLLVIHQKLPRELRAICDLAKEEPAAMIEIERRTLGFDHQELGAALAMRWKFPSSVSNAIAFHHRPSDAPDEHKPITALIYVADTLCCQTDEGFNLTALRQETDDELLTLIPAARDVVVDVQASIKTLAQMACPFTM